MVDWLFPIDEAIEGQHNIQDALETLLVAPLDHCQRLLEECPLLLADNTMATLCLTMLQELNSDDPSAIPSLVAALTLLDTARTQGIVATCIQYIEHGGDDMPPLPAFRQVALCTFARTKITKDAYPSVWARLHWVLADAYVSLMEQNMQESIQAIRCYEAALAYFSAQDFPYEYTVIHFQLFSLYAQIEQIQQSQAALASAREVIAQWVNVMDQQEEPPESDSPVPGEEEIMAVVEMLVTSYGDELYSCIQEHEAIILSKQMRQRLRQMIEELTPDNTDGRTEYLTIRLQLLEAIYAFNMQFAWNIFIEEQAQALQVLQKIQGMQPEEIVTLLQNQVEAVITLSMLALLHTMILEARRQNYPAVAHPIEVTLRMLKTIRQHYASQTIPTASIALQALSPEFQQVLHLLRRFGPEMKMMVENTDIVELNLLLQEMSLRPLEQRQKFLSLMARLTTDESIRDIAHDIAEPWLDMLDRQTTPYMWATTLILRCLVRLEDRAYDYEQVIDDCTQALEVVQHDQGAQMWAHAHLARAMASMNFLLTSEPVQTLGLAERLRRVKLAIEDLEAAQSVPSLENTPQLYGWLLATRGLAYAEREVYEKGSPQLLAQAEADFERAIPLLKQHGPPFFWIELYVQRASIYCRREQEDRQRMLALAIADCNIAINACRPPRSQDIAEVWAGALMVRGVAYLEYVQKGTRRANIEQGIADFNSALTVNTRESLLEEWARTLVNRGRAYQQRVEGDHSQNIEQALQDYSEALTVLTEQSAPMAWAKALTMRGNCYLERHHYDRAYNQQLALQDFDTVLAVFHDGEHAARIRAAALVGRANVRLLSLSGGRKSNLLQAVDDFSAALALLPPEISPLWRAITLMNRAVTYRTLALYSSLAMRGRGIRAMLPQIPLLFQEGIIPSVEPLFKEKIAYFEQAFDDFDLALTTVRREETPYEWAKIYMERALTHAGLIYRAFNFSHVNRKMHLRQAIADYSKALEVLNPEQFPFDWAMVLNNRAFLNSESTKDKNSEEIIQAIKDTNAVLSVFTLEVAPSHYFRTKYIQAEIFEKIADWQAVHEALLAVRVAQRDIVAMAASQINSLDLIAEFSLANIYIHDAWAMLHLDQPDLKEVVLALEEGRARAIRAEFDLDTPHTDIISQPEARARMTAFGAARKRLLDCQQRMLEPLPNGVDGGREKERRRQALDRAYQTFLQARKAIQEYDDPTFMTSQPNFAEIAAVIEDPTMALVYLVPEDTFLDQWRGMAMLVMRDQAGETQVRHIALPSLTDFALFDLFDMKEDAPPTIRAEAAIGRLGSLGLQRVSDILWEAGIRRIVCIAYGWSGILPLPATLIKRHDGSRVAMNKIFEMTLAPSALTVATARKYLYDSEKQRHTFLFAGDPQTQSEEFKRLPYARAEAETLYYLAKGYGYPDTHIRYLLRHKANKSGLVAALEHARYAHLALHGVYDLEKPRDSHLVLASRNQQGRADITLGEILDGVLDLKGLRLLVLSACQTSVIDMQRTPDEVLGLAAGFHKAGVATIIATLWAVKDKASYLLMSRFAQLYLDPQNLWTPARALAEAQHWLRTEATNRVLTAFDPFLPGSTHPKLGYIENIRIEASQADPDVLPYRDAYYWAGFVLVGCP